MNYLGPNDIEKFVDYTNDFQLYINLNPKIFASNGKTQTCNEVEIIRHGWLEYIYIILAQVEFHYINPSSNRKKTRIKEKLSSIKVGFTSH